MRVYRNMIIVLLLLLVASAGDAQEAYYGEQYYVAVSPTSTLNVREAAGMDTYVIITLERGEIVTATGYGKGEWIEVDTGKVRTTYSTGGEAVKSVPIIGWVHLYLLSTEEPYNNAKGTICADGRVRLRDAPDGDFVQWLAPGDEVTVHAILRGDAGYWYKVQYGEVCGWVASDYVEMR